MDEKEALETLRRRIRLLHEYNDLKDTTTMLIGIVCCSSFRFIELENITDNKKYAQKTGCTLVQAYEHFGIQQDLE